MDGSGSELGAWMGAGYLMWHTSPQLMTYMGMDAIALTRSLTCERVAGGMSRRSVSVVCSTTASSLTLDEAFASSPSLTSPSLSSFPFDRDREVEIDEALLVDLD